jgi:hypothetical protein
MHELLEEAADVECERECRELGGRPRRGTVEPLGQNLDGSRHALDGSAVGCGVPLPSVSGGDEAKFQHHESPRPIASSGEPPLLDEGGDVIWCAMLLQVSCLLAGSRLDASLEQRQEQVGLGPEV